MAIRAMGQSQMDRALNALRTMRRNGVPVDPDNQVHVEAYFTMLGRPQRLTAQRLVDYINSLQETVNTGEETKYDFWLVPKGNFPDGLPDYIKQAEVDPQLHPRCDSTTF